MSNDDPEEGTVPDPSAGRDAKAPFLSRRADRVSLAILAFLMFLVAVGHLVLIRLTPDIGLGGDEHGYCRWAQEDADQGNRSLLPGRLPFGQRPPLTRRILAQLAVVGEQNAETLFLRVRHYHVALLVIILVCVYINGRLLGLGPGWALLAPALLGFFPWFGHFVHSFFADVTRTTLVCAAMTFILAHLVSGRYRYLVPGGILGGFAILARVSIYQFMVVAVGAVVIGAIVDHRGRPMRVRIVRGVAPGLLLAGLLILVVAPQLVRNHKDGYGWRLAANSWRNIEFGLKRPTRSDPREVREAYTYRDARREYVRGGGDLPRKEKEARARTLAYIASTPLGTLVARQTEKWIEFFLIQRSYFEDGIRRKRWGADTSWVETMRWPARVMWYLIMTFCLLAIPLAGWRSRGWMFVSLFVLYYLAGTWVVGFAMRFSVVFMPWLVLMAAAGVFRIVVLVDGRRKHPAFREGRSLI